MSDSANPNRNEADHQKADTLDSSFLSGANATFIAEMSEAWRHNPRAVDASWARYFEQLESVGDIEEKGPNWGNG
jgi:2-oxoglutarate dehydrogenase E1 component